MEIPLEIKDPAKKAGLVQLTVLNSSTTLQNRVSLKTQKPYHIELNLCLTWLSFEIVLRDLFNIAVNLS